MIYFISDGQFVKIGRAKDIADRFCSIQVGNPRDLTLLGVIKTKDESEDKSLENKIHGIFSDLRARGEWFGFGIRRELEKYIKKYSVPGPDIKTKKSNLICFFNKPKERVLNQKFLEILERRKESIGRGLYITKSPARPYRGLENEVQTMLYYGMFCGEIARWTGMPLILIYGMAITSRRQLGNKFIQYINRVKTQENW